MEQHGNATTYNLESVLVQNIKTSPYYIKKAFDLENTHEAIDEIYETVDNVEPWLSGNARGPSSAFCLLYRLGELKPAPREVREMLDHADSPYIRAVGFLYLRYCCNPRELWSWFKKYMRDSERFSPSSGSFGKEITIGDFARDILLDQYYFETIFPRIPKTVSDAIKAELQSMGLPTKAVGNGGQGGGDRRGVDDGSRRPASVKASLSVAMGQRAPNRAGAREVGRGMGADLDLDKKGKRRRSRSSDRGRSKGGGRDTWDSRDRGRHRSRSRSRDRRDYGRGRDRSRSRDRGGRHYNDGRDSRRRDDDYNRRRDDASSRRRRSHSRSPSRGGGGGGEGGRDARDVFKERPVSAPVQTAAHLRDMY